MSGNEHRHPIEANRTTGDQVGDRAGNSPAPINADTRRGHVSPLTLFTRRRVVQSGGLLAASAGVAGFAVGCGPWDNDDFGGVQNTDPAHSAPVTFDQASGVEDTPSQIPDAAQLKVLSVHEAATIEALTARILPGTPDDPGAREAGVVTYIDNFLAFNDGYAEWTYVSGPWAEVEQSGGQGSGGTPAAGTPMAGTPTAGTPMLATPMSGALVAGTPAAGSPSAATPMAADPTEYEVIRIPGDQIKRYGYQSRLSPLQVYRIGVQAVDKYASGTFGMDVASLSEQQQDQVVGALADGSATGFPPELSASSFFSNLRRHTSEGMFSDPVYGGNRNMVGWKLVGFPGAQRAYQPHEFQQEGGSPREPQSILQMSVFHAGHHEHDSNALYPVSGTDEENDVDQPTGN